MKIAAITKYKHGLLRESLDKLHWTQKELAMRVGISLNHCGHILNLMVVPGVEVKQAIQRVLGEQGVFLDLEAAWPADFVPLKQAAAVVQYGEVESRALAAWAEQRQLAGGSAVEELEKAEQREWLQTALGKIPEAYRTVLEGRLDGLTLRDVADRIDVTKERARQIELNAVRVIRHMAYAEGQFEPPPSRTERMLALVEKFATHLRQCGRCQERSALHLPCAGGERIGLDLIAVWVPEGDWVCRFCGGNCQVTLERQFLPARLIKSREKLLGVDLGGRIRLSTCEAGQVWEKMRGGWCHADIAEGFEKLSRLRLAVGVTKRRWEEHRQNHWEINCRSTCRRCQPLKDAVGRATEELKAFRLGADLGLLAFG